MGVWLRRVAGGPMSLGLRVKGLRVPRGFLPSVEFLRFRVS